MTPYAPPKSEVRDPPGHDFPLPELRAAVGRNADYYLHKWHTTARGGFNWAAFFLSGLWLPYRKMYRISLILYSAIILETVAEEILFVGWLGYAAVPLYVGSGVGTVVSLGVGAFGNRWYQGHVTRLLQRVRDTAATDEQRLGLLQRTGGTSVLAAVGMLALFFVGIVGAVIGMEWFLRTESGGITTS